MNQYIVKRYGSNSANQRMCEEAVLGFFEGETEDAALEEARKFHTVYANQHLSAIPLAETTEEDCETAQELSAYEDCYCPLCDKVYSAPRCECPTGIYNDCDCHV